MSQLKAMAEHRPLGEAQSSPVRNGFMYNRDTRIVIVVVSCISLNCERWG